MAYHSSRSAFFTVSVFLFASSGLADEEAVYPGEIAWSRSGQLYGHVERIGSPRFSQPSGPVRIRLFASTTDPHPSLHGRSIPLRYVSFPCSDDTSTNCYHVYDTGYAPVTERPLAEVTHTHSPHLTLVASRSKAVICLFTGVKENEPCLLFVSPAARLPNKLLLSDLFAKEEVRSFGSKPSVDDESQHIIHWFTTASIIDVRQEVLIVFCATRRGDPFRHDEGIAAKRAVVAIDIATGKPIDAGSVECLAMCMQSNDIETVKAAIEYAHFHGLVDLLPQLRNLAAKKSEPVSNLAEDAINSMKP